MPGLAVVTGATSGIGAALAAGLARRGNDLLLVARSADALNAQAGRLSARYGVAADVSATDLTDPRQRGELAARLSETRVQVLCANAGTAGFGDFASVDNLASVGLDVDATVAMIAAVLPGMLARQSGALLLTGSLAGNQPMPGAAAYAAGKAFVVSLGVALHHELRGSGVACTVLTPGPVRTAFTRRAGLDGAVTRSPAGLWADADEVAEAGLRALARNRRRVTPRALPKVVAAAGRLAPRPVAVPIVAAIVRRIGGH